MKGTMRGHRLALVSITAVLTSLVSVPAWADEGPLVTATTTVDDISDAATTTVDEVSDAAASAVDIVDTATAATADAVTDASATAANTVSTSASGAADTITSAASDAEGSVVASAGNLTDVVGDGAGVGDASSGSATVESSVRGGESSSRAGSSFDSTQGAIRPRSGLERTVLTPAGRAENPRWAVHDTTSCPGAGGPRCSPTSGTGEEDSLGEKISEVLGILASTGALLLPWIAAALGLTVLGSVVLERSRGTGSRVRRVTAA